MSLAGAGHSGDGRIDRRSFVLAAGAAALSGCGAGSGTSARRRPRIPPGLEHAVRGQVLVPGDASFADAAHVYNERFDDVRPLAVARPLDSADVRGAVRWALSHGVPVRARSGGHSYAGYSTLTDGVVLDLRQLRTVAVDRRSATATIGAGAQLIDVYLALASQGVTLPGGSCPSVGITGVALGGGMGLAARAFGMTADNLRGARIVTADGRLRTVRHRDDHDLLWALRGGGGGNFGVVTELRFRVHPMPASASYFFVSWPWSAAADALDAWQHWAPHTTDALTSIFHLSAAGGRASVMASGQYLGPSSALGALLAPLRAPGNATVVTGDRDYPGLQLLWAGCSQLSVAACHTAGTRPGGTLPRESFRAKSDYVRRSLPASARAGLVAAIERRTSIPGSGAILFDAYGGAINRVAPDATAFVHRDELFCMQYLSYNGGADWLRATHAAMRRHVSGRAYQNYIDPELHGWHKAYYGANYRRLESIRRAVDPHHFFNFPQAIGR